MIEKENTRASISSLQRLEAERTEEIEEPLISTKSHARSATAKNSGVMSGLRASCNERAMTLET